MKTISNFLTSLIIASWIGGIAIFSMQNIQPISLKFLWFESIQLTTGLVFSLSIGIGLILGSILLNSGAKTRKQVTQRKPSKAKFSRPRREDFEETNKQNEKEDWTQKPSENW